MDITSDRLRELIGAFQGRDELQKSLNRQLNVALAREYGYADPESYRYAQQAPMHPATERYVAENPVQLEQPATPSEVNYKPSYEQPTRYAALGNAPSAMPAGMQEQFYAAADKQREIERQQEIARQQEEARRYQEWLAYQEWLKEQGKNGGDPIVKSYDLEAASQMDPSNFSDSDYKAAQGLMSQFANAKVPDKQNTNNTTPAYNPPAGGSNKISGDSTSSVTWGDIGNTIAGWFGKVDGANTANAASTEAKPPVTPPVTQNLEQYRPYTVNPSALANLSEEELRKMAADIDSHKNAKNTFKTLRSYITMELNSRNNAKIKQQVKEKDAQAAAERKAQEERRKAELIKAARDR